MRQSGIDCSAVVAAKVLETIIETLFAMIGNIDDNGILVLKTTQYLIDNGVVIQRGIVIVGQDIEILFGQIGTVIVLTCPFPLFIRITGVVVYMLPHHVEDNQVAVLIGRWGYLPFFHHRVVVA